MFHVVSLSVTFLAVSSHQSALLQFVLSPFVHMMQAAYGQTDSRTLNRGTVNRGTIKRGQLIAGQLIAWTHNRWDN